jgi:NADH dehydrogenase (ubiquinone) Fe-S protein 3
MFVKTSHLEIFKSNQFGLNSNAHTLIRNLQQIFEGVTKVAYTPDSLTFHVSAKDFFFFMYFLKASTLTAADQLVEISCVDNLTKNQRFELNYHLLSLSFSTRYMVTINIDELESVPSISKIYFNAA